MTTPQHLTQQTNVSPAITHSSSESLDIGASVVVADPLQPNTAIADDGPALPGLLAGLTYQTPVIGTIRIGATTEANGRRLPFTDDKFSIHTRYRDSNGDWVAHGVQNTLQSDKANLRNDRLCSIPVRIIYDNPNLNMGEQYAAFRTDGRPACVGNGVKAKRAVNGKVECVECPGPAACQFGDQKEHRCETFARALFHIEGQDVSEGAFIFRTGSYNSVNDMRVRLQSLHAGFGGKLSGLPMKLEMRLKSTAQSYKQAFYYVSLEPRFAGFKEAMDAINERDQSEKACGFNRKAFENSMAQLLANGSFNENAEDAGEYEDLIVARPDLQSNKVIATVGGPTQIIAPSDKTLEGISSMYTSPRNSASVSPVEVLNG